MCIIYFYVNVSHTYVLRNIEHDTIDQIQDELGDVDRDKRAKDDRSICEWLYKAQTRRIKSTTFTNVTNVAASGHDISPCAAPIQNRDNPVNKISKCFTCGES